MNLVLNEFCSLIEVYVVYNIVIVFFFFVVKKIMCYV